MSLASKGRRKSKEHIKNISLSKLKEYENGRESPFKKIWKDNPDYLKGENNVNWKGGQTKEERSWQKNKRNRVIKRLKIESLSHTFGEWELLKKQYGFTCPCCNKQEPEIKLTEDHIIPLSKGGTDLIENIQPLCLLCNMRKHTLIIKY